MPHSLGVAELKDLARAQYARKDFTKAKETLDEAIQLSVAPDETLFDYRIRVHQKLDQLDLALKDAKLMIKTSERRALGYQRAAQILQSMDKHATAIEILKRGIKKDAEPSRLLHKLHDDLSRSLCPVTGTDPFAVFPIELVQETLSYLAFRGVVVCTRVSKKWKALIIGLPSLWMNLDLSWARRPVRSSFVFHCINRSRNMLKSADLQRVLTYQPVLSRLASQCHHLQRLDLQIGRSIIESDIAFLARITRLEILAIGSGSPIDETLVPRLATTCTQLRRLELHAVTNSGRRGVTWPTILPNLGVIRLEFENDVADMILRSSMDMSSLVEAVPNLTTLSLRRWRPEAFAQESLNLRSLSNLTELELLVQGALRTCLPHGLNSLTVTRSITFYNADTDSPTRPTLPQLSTLQCETFEQSQALLHEGGLDQDAQYSSLEPFKGRPTLQTLRITDVSFDISRSLEDSRTFAQMSGHLTDVRDLHLSFLKGTDAHWAPIIASQCKQVRRLSLQNSDITGVGVKALVSALEHLETLNVSFCHDLSPDAIEWARNKAIHVTIHLLPGSGRKVRYG